MYAILRKFRVLLLGLVFVATPVVIAENQLEDINQLLVQGHFWYASGRNDLAQNAWRKVLRAEPDNSEANNALDELDRYDPDKINHQKLALARELARSGRFQEALDAYKEAFQGPPPTSFHAAEYFETLGGSKARWAEAVLGLRQLVERYPSNTAYTMSLARVLSYREKTRREAIAIFESLNESESQNDTQRNKLIENWHDALIWLNAKKSDLPLIERYLVIQPNDQALITLKNELSIAHDHTLAGAYEFLENNQLSKASAGFLAVLKRQPNNADALAGLGIIKLRQREFDQAKRYLSQAITKDPRKQKTLGPSLEDAFYWGLYNRGQEAYEHGRTSEAGAHARQLTKIRPDQIEGLLLRARVAADNANYAAAIKLYERVLHSQPDNAQAQNGLVGVLINQGDEDQALALMKIYNLSEKDYLTARDRIVANRLRARANLTSARDEALVLLNNAMKLSPDDPWIRLDLARLHRQQNQTEKAVSLLQALIDKRPTTDAIYAKSLYHYESEAWTPAFKTLGQLEATQRQEKHRRLLTELQARVMQQEILKQIEQGNLNLARQQNEQLLRLGADAPRVKLIYADLLVDLGDKEKAAWHAERTLASLAEDDLDLQIAGLAVLLRANKLPADDPQLTELRFGRQLTARQSESIRKLHLAATLQQADRELRAGQAEAAYETLKPFIPTHNEDPGFKLLLASVYHENQQYYKALALFQDVLTESPDNLDAVGGAFGSAMALREYDLAQSLTERGLKAVPESPRLIAQRAQLDLLRGRRSVARQDLKLALQAKADPSSEATPFWREQAQESLNTLEQQDQSWLSPGVALRTRGNDDGLDKLSGVAIPMIYHRSLDNGNVDLTLKVNPVDLHTGTLSATNAANYGSLALSTAPNNTNAATSDAEGIGINLKLSTDDWVFKLGHTPHDFQLDNVTGAVAWKTASFDHKLKLEFGRHAIKESLLAYAGSYDPGTDSTWGGVVSTGLHATLEKQLKTPANLYAELDWQQLTGTQVKDNKGIKALGGISWPLLQESSRNLSLGTQLLIRQYDHNLSHFTLGHGGYFSPQNYFSLSFPLSYEQTLGPFSWRFISAIGWQKYKQEAVDIFPEHPVLQAALAAETAADPTRNARHAKAEKSDAVYTLRGEFGYSLDKRLQIGGWAAFNNSNNFDESAGGVFLRYFWNAASQRKFAFNETLINPEVW